MKVVLEVKNASGLTKPEKDTVILYNGKQWYTITLVELMKEAERRHQKAFDRLELEYKVKLDELEKRFKELSETVTTQNEAVVNLVEGLLETKE